MLELIDADAHAEITSPTFWDEYFALPNTRGARTENRSRNRSGPGHDWVVFEGARKPLSLNHSVAGHGKQFKIRGRKEDLRDANWEPAARLADMDTDGIQTAFALWRRGRLAPAIMTSFLRASELTTDGSRTTANMTSRGLAVSLTCRCKMLDLSIELLIEAAKAGA